MTLSARLRRLEKTVPVPRGAPPLARYAADPCGYARDVLGVTWTPVQMEIARKLLKPPYKVLVKASHSVGKTYLAAGLINWWYDAIAPSACITTAPTAQHVRDVLWREVRLQRGRRGGFTGPRSCELRDAADHYAIGYTAESGEAFQGRHQARMLFAFDEAVGVDQVYWDTTKSMFDGSGQHAWLAIMNPTDTTSQAYAEEATGEGCAEEEATGEGCAEEEATGEGWHVVTMSALDHPNIAAGLRGEPLPYPGAVSLAQVNDWVRDWATPIPAGERRATDIEWPPDSGQWVRPGPLFESRVLGRWPSGGTYGVWNDSLFAAAEHLHGLLLGHVLPEIGCDPARFGDDFTAIVVRWGDAVVHHERHNGWSLAETAGRLKQLARAWCERVQAVRDPAMPPVRPEQILVKVDADGLGAGVVDQREDYAFVGVSAAATARNPADYPNQRSQLWFHAAERASEGRLSLAGLSLASRRILRRQAMAPEWKVDGQGRCVVEPKDRTKERLGASPDDMDALNLAFWPAAPFSRPGVVPDPQPTAGPREGGQAERLGLFGMKGKR